VVGVAVARPTRSAEGAGDYAALSYRPDVDGLRAIAVAGVVAYHNFPKTAHGGFIGVDIFFVISGFLITSILAREIDAGGIGFVGFYARRARRIFPALAVVLLATLVLGTVLLTPEAYRALGLQTAAGAASASNLLLWAQAGYFDDEAATKPLLHLWSLGIEEQFYLSWPLALALCARVRIPLVALAGFALAASFALNLYLVERDPVADFYLVFSRIWELLIGGILALMAARRSRGVDPASPWLSIVGAALIVASFLWIGPLQAFPGWRALGPTLGTALLIAAPPTLAINRLALARAPMVALGKISYPLYLWHWPLLTLARIREGGTISLAERWVLIALSVGLAYATYVHIERPIRLGAARRRLTGAVAVAILALGAIGLYDYRFGGLFFSETAFMKIAHDGDVGSSAYGAYYDSHTSLCETDLQPEGRESGFDMARCRQSKASGRPGIMLIGDSHAHQLMVGLAEALPERNVGYFGGALLHIFDDPRAKPVYRALAAEPRLRAVLIAARWSERRRRFEDKSAFRAELRQVVQLFELADKRVYLVLDTPSFPFGATFCKYSEPMIYETRCETDAASFEQTRRESIEDLGVVAQEFPGVRILDSGRYLCHDDVCSMASGDKLLFRDANHLNLLGSRFVAAKLLAGYPDIAD
jgi:peptidoglycan/LPS O-acetylase OafA/YrhL